MERSWWIVLVLICNLSYGQVSSGAIANNRFLQRTNPQIDRAIADGGSSLDHPEIQKLARQMVDLGIWGNLMIWANSRLVKERISGSDTYVTKVYDISGNNKDYEQATDSYQPLLTNNSFAFNDGRKGLIGQNHAGGLAQLTVTFWLKLNTVANGGTNASTIMLLASKAADGATSVANLDWSVYYDRRTANQNLVFVVARDGTVSSSVAINVPINIGANTWRMITCTWNPSTSVIIYINGSQIAINTTSIIATMSNKTINLNIGGVANTNERTLDGEIEDIRIFNAALTASQINAIFQQTRGKYGI